MNSSIPFKTRQKQKKSGRGISFRYLLPGLCILAVIALSACGLETIIFLDGPRPDTFQPSSAESGIPFAISFLHNTSANNVPEFLGYELYYKFYDDFGGAGANPEDAPHQQDKTAIEATPRALGPSRLEARGYRRVRSQTGARPLIRVPDGDKGSTNFRIFVTFQDKPEIDPGEQQAIAFWPVDQPGATFIVFRRSSNATNGHPFLPVEEELYVPSGDFLDIPATFAAVPGQTARDIATIINAGDLAIGFYVLAYGINPQNFQEIYSEPVSLSYAKVQ